MSHLINHDAILLFVLFAHANLHETNLPVYIVTIAVNIIYIFDCHAKSAFYLLDDLYLKL